MISKVQCFCLKLESENCYFNPLRIRVTDLMPFRNRALFIRLVCSFQLLSTHLPYLLERKIKNKVYPPISMAFLGIKLLPIEAIMTKPIAAHCNKLSCSLKITRPASAAIAGSKLISTLKACVGIFLRAIISKE